MSEGDKEFIARIKRTRAMLHDWTFLCDEDADRLLTLAEPSRETAKPETEPALSAEQIEVMRALLIKVGLNPALCDMALSSLTAREPTSFLKERAQLEQEWAGLAALKRQYKSAQDEGIEAIAKHFESQPHAEWWTPNIVDEIRSLKDK